MRVNIILEERRELLFWIIINRMKEKGREVEKFKKRTLNDG